MSVSQLYIPFQDKINQLEKLIKNTGLKIYRYSDYRSFLEQKKLYAQGRTTPGNIVTFSPPGYSLHNYGLAADYVWGGPGKWTWEASESKWEQFADLAEFLGFESGRRWGRKQDNPHVQITYGLSIEKLYSVYSKTWKLVDVWAFIDGYRQ